MFDIDEAALPAMLAHAEDGVGYGARLSGMLVRDLIKAREMLGKATGFEWLDNGDPCYIQAYREGDVCWLVETGSPDEFRIEQVKTQEEALDLAQSYVRQHETTSGPQ